MKEELKRKINGTLTNKAPLVIQLSNSKSLDPKGPASPTRIYLNESSTSALSHAHVSDFFDKFLETFILEIHLLQKYA